MENSQPRRFTERIVPFTAGDGLACNLVNVRGDSAPKGPVILVHGAGVRANIFRAPVEENIVTYLASRGYDVWLENWRASIDLPLTQWTLDGAARDDHPRAVETVIRETGADSVQAVIHCQGATSFMLAAVAGLVPQVRTVVSNAVALHPVVPAWSRFKLQVLLPLLARMSDNLNPAWDSTAPGRFGRAMYRFADTVHRECDNGVCKQVSLYYGAGFPALWLHENLDDTTHEWLRGEFASCPMSFYRQIAMSVSAGHLVPTRPDSTIPADITARPPLTDARFVFLTGESNRCFLPESQVRTHEWFDRHAPGRHDLHIIPRYSHLDVFMGHRANEDTFPLIEAALARPH